VADLKNRTKTKYSEKQVTSSRDHLFFSVNGLFCMSCSSVPSIKILLVLCKLDLLKENLSNILFFPS